MPRTLIVIVSNLQKEEESRLNTAERKQFLAIFPIYP